MNLREWALPVYTILIQLATGGLVALWLIRWRFSRLGGKTLDRMTRVPILIFASTIAVAVVGAHFHLSKPFLSLFAMTNIAHSWLSREIFSTVLLFVSVSTLTVLTWGVAGRYRLKTILGWICIVLGVITVFAMASIYLLPTQIAWNSALTILTYYVEAALIGATALSAILLMDLNFQYEQDPNGVTQDAVVNVALKGLLITAVIALLANLVLNGEQIIFLNSLQNESAQMSLELLSGLYQPLFLIRLVLGVAGISLFLASYLRNHKENKPIRQLILPAYMVCTMVLVGEIIGRFLFYAVHVRSGI